MKPWSNVELLISQCCNSVNVSELPPKLMKTLSVVVSAPSPNELDNSFKYSNFKAVLMVPLRSNTTESRIMDYSSIVISVIVKVSATAI